MPDFDDFNNDEAELTCPVCGDPNCPGCGPSMQRRLIKLALIPLGVIIAALVLRGLITSSGAEDFGVTTVDQEEVSTTPSISTPPAVSEPEPNGSTTGTTQMAPQTGTH